MNAFLQVSVIGLSPPLTVQMAQMEPNLQHTYQFGLPNGQYRVEWDFRISIGYAFIREVSSTPGMCNFTGMSKSLMNIWVDWIKPISIHFLNIRMSTI